jgi:hypothetical protein
MWESLCGYILFFVTRVSILTWDILDYRYLAIQL